MSRQVEAIALDKTIESNRVISAVRYGFSGSALKKSVLIGLIVGILLTVANQYDVISRGPIPATLLVKICFNFVIPFVVSSVSAYANRGGP